MTEFHFEDPDLKNSTLEIGFPSCAIEKDNFTGSRGKRIPVENKEPFQTQVRKQREHLRCRCSTVLVAKGPYFLVPRVKYDLIFGTYSELYKTLFSLQLIQYLQQSTNYKKYIFMRKKSFFHTITVIFYVFSSLLPSVIS